MTADRAAPRPPAGDNRAALGSFAERLAATHLAGKGYTIVCRNVRVARGEIDIVAVQADTTVLVEVRARREGDLGSALWALDRRKQQRMLRAAAAFLNLHPELPQVARIDFVAVTLSARGIVQAIEHIESAVEG